MAAKEPDAIDDGIAEPGIEPGASTETMLVTTDSFDEYEQEMSSSIDDRHMKESTASTISVIQENAQDIPAAPIAASASEPEKTLCLDDSDVACFHNLLPAAGGFVKSPKSRYFTLFVREWY